MMHTFRRIWSFAEKQHTVLIQSLICSFFRSAFGVTQLLAVIYALQVVTKQIPVSDALWKVVLLTVICVAGTFLTSFFEQTGTLKADFYMVGDKRVSLGRRLRQIPLGFFNASSTGKISATLTTTLAGVETAATMVMVGIVSGLFSACCLFVFMLFYDWRIGLLTGAGMAVYLLIVRWQMVQSRKNAPALQQAQTTLADAVLSFLHGIRVTKSFSYTKGDEQVKKAVQGSCDANIRLTSKSMPAQFSAGLAIALFESAILLLGLWFCFHEGQLDPVKAIVLILFSFMAYASLNQAGSMLSMIGLLDAGMQEVEALEQEETMQQVRPSQTPESDNISLQKVSFAYGTHEVLHQVSCEIPSHALTALIGPSGSGKTTLCQLIARFRDADEGTVSIGGADVKQIPNEELMAKISMVFQNVYLFEDTVFNNIRFGKPDATPEEVQEAAKKACCHDFIMALPDGYDTLLKEGGNSLSGGEKQRISIARAMLKNAPIILLDEATSALDAENEQEILQAIDALTADKTVIMIAHRLKTVQKADKILCLKEGRIVQEGTHESLKAVPGLYADFLASREKAAAWQLNR